MQTSCAEHRYFSFNLGFGQITARCHFQSAQILHSDRLLPPLYQRASWKNKLEVSTMQYVFQYCSSKYVITSTSNYIHDCDSKTPQTCKCAKNCFLGAPSLFHFLETTSPARWEPPDGGPPALLSRKVVSRRRWKKQDEKISALMFVRILMERKKY